MSQADAENWCLAREVANQIDADAGVLRRAGTGGDHDALRLHRVNLCNCDLIVATHLDFGTKFPKILNQVIGKGIVVVENEDHRLVQCLAYHWLRSDL